MRFKSQEPNAMILPIPVALPAQENAVRFINLEDHPDFFDYLDSAFPQITMWMSAKIGGDEDDIAMLDVEEVGDYIASFVPTKHDFERLDKRFRFSEDIWEQLPQYEDYGFVVFQLKELSGSTHPMAFEFQTRMSSQLFFPTLHIHDKTVDEKAKFDHLFYMQCEKYDAPRQKYIEMPSQKTGMFQSIYTIGDKFLNKNPENILQSGLFLHKTLLRGTYPNKDLILTT
jgi:hypothetical protein